MKKVFYLISLLMFCVGYSQNNFRKADKLFDKLAYKAAAAEYESVLKEVYDEVDVQVYKNLADSYYNFSDMKSACKWYGVFINNETDLIEPEYYLKYAHALEGVKKYEESKKWMIKYAAAINNGVASTSDFSLVNKKLEDVLGTRNYFKIHNLESINTKYSDFGAAFLGDLLVYASAKPIEEFDQKIYEWNKQPYLNLYSSRISDIEGELFNVKLLDDINSQYHESNIAYAKVSEGVSKVYFTKNNYKNKLKKDEEGSVNLKIFSADVHDYYGYIKFDNVQELPFNNDDYSVGHPALSADQSKLYFVSNMPGSLGQTDIFYVDILGDNSFSEPINLGPTINTEGREMFPYIAGNDLYFSSDGHLGFGSLDVFIASKSGDYYSKPVNLGAPINSNMDDFSFVFNFDKQLGYFSSNREGGKGDDDIYSIFPSFEGSVTADGIKSNLNLCSSLVEGSVFDLSTSSYIPNVFAFLYDQDHHLVEISRSDMKGKFEFFKEIPCNSNYSVEFQKIGYTFESSKFKTLDEGGVTNVKGIANLDEKFEVTENGRLKIGIRMINFDLNKSFIRKDAEIELNKIVYVMNNYPEIKIKIESHTDSRSGSAYNRKLSQDRANSSRQYIIDQGIDASRILDATGYGESRLLNKCADGVKCSEYQHQANRRSEFIVVEN